MMFFIGFALLLLSVQSESSDRSLKLVILVDLHDSMENLTLVQLEQFILSVGNKTFEEDADTSIAVLQSSCFYWWRYWSWYYDNCMTFHMNFTSLQNSLSFTTKIGSLPIKQSYYFINKLYTLRYFFEYNRSNNTAEMILMISDGYYIYTKEHAQPMLKDGITIAAVVRTDNDTDIHNMENATGDPSLVLPIVSFDDLPSVVDDCVQIILTGEGNTSGVPNYHVSHIAVEYHLNWENGIPALSFVCTFELISDNHNLVYSVTWYANGRIIGQDRLFRANETAKNVLYEKELADNGYYHGIYLKCSVSAKFSFDGRRGKRYSSNNFFAGIEVLTKSINLEENKEAVLTFRPTVPFACENAQDDCFLSVHVENPESMSCKGNAVVRSSGRCRVEIPGYSEVNKTYYSHERNWKLEYNLTVKHTQSTSYDRDSYYTIALITSTVYHKFWSQRQLSNIPVYIYSNAISWRGAYCYSHIDPHDRTFDARNFEQQKQGRYIMYRNKKLDQEVQYETEACLYNDRTPFCICGLAIRAGKDVFLMYICHESRIIDFVSCGDNTLTVESDRFSGYKVLFPHGTQVNIRMICWWGNCFMNVDIYPTGADVDSTEGLCGTFDGDCNNDFLKRDGSYSSTVTNDACPPPYSYIFPDDFSESWRTNSDEDLLPPISQHVYDNLSPWSQNLLLCSCVFEEVNGTSRPSAKIDTVDCSYKSYRDCIVSRYTPFSCDVPQHGNTRKRREISGRSKRSTKESIDARIHQVDKRSTTMTELEARYHCNNTLYSSNIYRLCLESVTEINDSYMEDCVLDVKDRKANDLSVVFNVFAGTSLQRSFQMTGDVNMSYVALQIVKDACLTIVGKNTTLNDSTPEIVYAVQTQSCPFECNQQGTCDNGVCDCDQGYGGDDCSVDLSDPPIVSGLSQGEYCDVAENECSLLKVYGRNFYSLVPRCRIEYKIIEENGTISGKNIIYLQGEQKSQFEAMCNIQSIRSSVETGSTPGFVTSYTISISNNNNTYSSNVSSILYDSGCQTRDESGERFVLKENYCYIESACYYHGNADPLTGSRTCCSTIDSFYWHPSSECDREEKKPEKDGDTNITTLVSAISVSFVVVTIGFILMYIKKSHCKRKEKEVQPTEDNLPSPPTMCQKAIFGKSNIISSVPPEATCSAEDRYQPYRDNINTPTDKYFYERTASLGSINIKD